MKITNRESFSCEQERERQAVLASEAVSECQQEESDKEADDKALREEAEIRRQEQEAESNNPLVQKIMAVLFYITAAVIILFVLGHFWSK